jgi:hypothetical protein
MAFKMGIRPMKTVSLALCAMVLCPVASPAADTAAAPARPHFVVILIDAKY